MRTTKEYYDDYAGNIEDYEHLRWFSRKASLHAYNQTKATIDTFLTNKKCKRIIEVGCGAGTWTKEIAKYSNTVLAVDISENMLEFAKKNIISDSIDFRVMDFLNIDESIYNNFDGLVTIRMLRFTNDLDLFLQKTISVIKPGGFCLIITVNPLWIKRKIIGSEEDKRVNITLRYPHSLKSKMVGYGFEDIKIRSAVIYMPPPLNPALKFYEWLRKLNQNRELSRPIALLAESYAIYSHIYGRGVSK